MNLNKYFQKILTVTLQSYAKINVKRLYKNLPSLFFTKFFSNTFQTDLIQMLK